MKTIKAFVLMLLAVTLLAGCGLSGSSADKKIETESETDDFTDADSSSSNNIVIVYFSRTGENYDVGVVDKGNTAIVADMIAEETGAEKFEIVPVTAYPESYDEMLGIAQQEASDSALPEYQGDVENWENYDTVFIGYPIWYGDMPRIIYTFLEDHDWTGKTVIPFDTNAGSGLAETESEISDETGTTVLGGLAVRGKDAQEDQNSVRESVQSWIEELGL